MTIEHADNQSAVTPRPAMAATQEPATVPATVPAAAPPAVRTASPRAATVGPGGSELIRRILVLVFGLIQIVIGARIVLLLLDARTGNALVSGVLNISQVFVAPFNGILHTNALTSGGSMLDLAAILAFIGWSIVELIVIWAVGIFRREPA